MTVWSPQQDHALLEVKQWLTEDNSPVFRLFGYAGTGKTTLARHFASHLNGDVRFGAFTGKAAQVLRNKGCEGAQTIHSMIYHPSQIGNTRYLEYKELADEMRQELRGQGLDQRGIHQNKEFRDVLKAMRDEEKKVGGMTFVLNEDSDVQLADLIIIDECSMVDHRMGVDLLSFGVKILVLGDPAQLPPIAGEGYFTSVEPDIMLNEIHRQALDNPIIELATRTRERKQLMSGTYGESLITNDVIDIDEALKADQILCARNATRHNINDMVRRNTGREGWLPEVGDKLVCLRNDKDAGVLNGTLWKVTKVGTQGAATVRLWMVSEDNPDDFVANAMVHTHHFKPATRGQKMQKFEALDALEFDFGYALTVHKAQGSQWKNVIVKQEMSFMERIDRWKWLYTAITRAEEKVTVARNWP